MDSPGLPVSTLVPTTFQQNIGIELRYAMQRLRIDCWINRNRKPRLFFASDLASCVSGQILNVDCGEFHAR